MKYVLMIVIGFLLTYLSMAFIVLSFNPIEWEQSDRFCLVSIGAFVSSILCYINLLISENKKVKE